MKRPSELPTGTTLNLFIKGIKPMWEVEEHKTGGSIRLQLAKGYSNQIWEDLILGFIGEQFEVADEVTGLVLNIGANMDKLSIWIRHGNNNYMFKKIKEDVIKITGLPKDVKTTTQIFHKD